MTEELKTYIENSKESRRKLFKLATDLSLKKQSKNSTNFPSVDPRGFKKFENALFEDLKTTLTRSKSKRNKSTIYGKYNISSIYYTPKVQQKRMISLPPVQEKTRQSLIERLLAGNSRELRIETSETLQSSKPARQKLTRFEVKKLLLEPVLRSPRCYLARANVN